MEEDIETLEREVARLENDLCDLQQENANMKERVDQLEKAAETRDQEMARMQSAMRQNWL